MWRAAAGNPDGNKPFTCWRLAVHPRIGGKLKASEVGVTLDEILNDAFGLLAAAIKDRAAPFRTVALATVAAEGAPDVRTVVLRSFDAGARRLSVHTDARSTKVAQIQAHPAVALLAWDPMRRLQLRLRGQASLRAGDAMTRDAWEGLPGATRHLYRLRMFFVAHDPTTPNRQGNDVGPQYRSIILTHDDAQHAAATRVRDEIAAARIWPAPIVTEIKPLDVFYPAEAEHHDYFARNPWSGYCQMVIAPKVRKFRKQFADRLRETNAA